MKELKSVEELRASGRWRQRRWRARHLEVARERDREWKRKKRSGIKGSAVNGGGAGL